MTMAVAMSFAMVSCGDKEKEPDPVIEIEEPITSADSAKLAAYVGNYTVIVTAVDTIAHFPAGTNLDTVPLTVSADGKVTASANIVMPATINLALRSFMVSPSNAKQVAFKVPSGKIEIPNIDTVSIKGTGNKLYGGGFANLFDGGFDGGVTVPNVTSISFEIAGTLSMGPLEIPLKISVSGAKQ